jgi:galactose mutarotase-like enzyme
MAEARRIFHPGFVSVRDVWFRLGVIYETSEDQGGLDTLEDPVGGLRVTIRRTGAEMVSLARRRPDGTWMGFLYRDGETGAPTAGWGNHATVMGYFLHRLWQEKSVYRGREIRGGNHGFLRHFRFAAPEVREGALIYRVAAAEIPAGAYPLRVALELRYQLSDAGLTVGFTFTNEEPNEDAQLSFGLHPGFAVSSPRTCRLILPTGTYVRHFAPGNFLDGRTEDIPFDGGAMPFDAEKLPDSFLLGLEKVPERIFRLEDFASGRSVRLDFSEVPFLTLWSDMNPFLCVEPCWGLPDSNPPVPFEQKLGLEVVPAGGSLARSFTILPDFLA